MVQTSEILLKRQTRALQVPITELPTLVEQKSKQTVLIDKPEPMSLPINDLP